MHFTYHAELDKTCLEQGDVLARTDAIDAILREVHPHYTKDDYKYLMVLTQSCDLVRRISGKRCKARYLSLAAVRPLSLVVGRELEKYQYDPMERNYRFCDAGRRATVEEFLGRLMNNNEPEYFYLHAELPAGLSEPHCAFLTLSIAIKSEFHYETCLAAKVLQLTEPFQHKLGWLTGNMYSRVGTDDWVPDHSIDDVFNDMIAAVLKDAVVWVATERRKALLRKLKAIPATELTMDRAHDEYEKLVAEIKPKKDVLLQRLSVLMTEVGIGSTEAKQLYNRVRSDADIAKLIK